MSLRTFWPTASHWVSSGPGDDLPPLYLTLTPETGDVPAIDDLAVRRWSDIHLSVARRTTHLWLDADVRNRSHMLQVMLSMDSLTHVAIVLRRSYEDPHVVMQTNEICTDLIHRHRATIVIIEDPDYDMGGFVERLRRLMNVSKRLHFMTGSTDVAARKKEWLSELDGAEDVWQKAANVRQAVLAEDWGLIERICPIKSYAVFP